MRSQSLFRRYFFVTAIIFAIVLMVASATSIFLRSLDHKRMIESGPLFFARLLAERKDNRIDMVKSLNRGFVHPKDNQADPRPPFELDLIDSSGKSLVTDEPHWSPNKYPQLQLSQAVLEVQRLDDNDGPSREMAIKLDHQSDQYLLVSFRPKDNPFPKFLLLNLITMGIAVILASGASAYFLFLSFRQKAISAEKVILELQHGNLKSRFPISKIDEFTHVMGSFNKMADEIERLVSSLKENEKERVGLLQELAHDLRTPVASLKNLMETFKENFTEMSGKTRDEVLSLAIEEIKYFERLMEDLLFLGQVMEPKYHTQSTDVIFSEVLDDQISVMKQKYPEVQVIVQMDSNVADQVVLGDEQLLRRMIRNGLENSFSFAKSEVEISVQKANGQSLQMCIRDNGPGLNAEALASFGKKRRTRTLKTEGSERLSVGLGSVIMIAIAQLHGGSVRIQNRSSTVPGAELTVMLPLRASA